MATTTTTSTIEAPTTKLTAQSTTDSDFIPRGAVTADLSFYNPPADGSKPLNYVEQPPAGQPQRNYSDITIPVNIRDVRDSPKNFTLDTNAFTTLTVDSPSSSSSSESKTDFNSDPSIKSTYYREIESLLLAQVPGATRVLIFDHTIRRADPAASRSPVVRVHIDQTPASAFARVRLHLGSKEEADEILLPANPGAEGRAGKPATRIRLINVWRPLNGPVTSFPLAFADSTTVPDEAIVPVTHRYPDRDGETAGVRHTGEEGKGSGQGQEWYYLSGMQNNERILLQCFDSELGARVPHSAFKDPRTPEGARGRESIEVRALVFG